MLRARWLIWSVVVTLLVTDAGASLCFGWTSSEFLALNNALQILAVVGVSNLWAQSGMKARDATLLGAGLIVYDALFTSVLPLMGELFQQLDGLPFAPLVAWPAGREGQSLAIGLGDLLLATVFPLVIRKAYSRRAGRVAVLVTCGALATVLGLPALGLTQTVFPVMVVLGPLMLAQYLYWRRQWGGERTMWQYRMLSQRLGGRGGFSNVELRLKLNGILGGHRTLQGTAR